MNLRRYDMVHDTHSGNWKMAKRADGQYVPFIDVEKLIEQVNGLALHIDTLNGQIRDLYEREDE